MIEQIFDAVMPIVLEMLAGLLIIALAMGLFIIGSGGCPPRRIK
jgi:hypothetical protein